MGENKDIDAALNFAIKFVKLIMTLVAFSCLFGSLISINKHLECITSGQCKIITGASHE